MAEGESTGSNAIWAVAMVIIVALIVGGVLYSGVLTQKKSADINITAPNWKKPKNVAIRAFRTRVWSSTGAVPAPCVAMISSLR